MCSSEFAMLAREGYPMNDLMRMAGGEYDVPADCELCGAGTTHNTGDESPPICTHCAAALRPAPALPPLDDDDDLPF